MNDQQKKLAAGGAFAVVAALVLYFELHDPSPPPPATPATVVSRPAVTNVPSSSVGGPVVRTSSGSSVKGTAAGSQQLDPTLHMGAMLLTESLAYSGSGRNIFSGGLAAAALASVPKPIAPARPKQIITTTVQMPVGPPPLPSIDLKFFGTETRGGGQRQAFLLRGEDVFLASAGEIVQRRYKVLSITAGSIVVEDLLNNNRQTLPLTN